MIVFAVLFELGLGLVGCVAAAIAGVEIAATVDLTPWGLALGVAAALPMLAVIGTLDRFELAWLDRISELVEQALAQLFSDASPSQIIAASLAAGIGEELLFRGFLQNLFVGWTGEIAGLVIASIGFGLIHAMTFGYAVVAGILGLYLGALYLWTGNLFVPIIAHAVYDAVAIAWMLENPRTLEPPPPVEDADTSQ
ncbi:MAG: membrane protease YdiL (CAAX protease family) [Hyphomicrobiaceae bacterium]|jgi:membrane protease YdiL (CAAX protease family)